MESTNDSGVCIIRDSLPDLAGGDVLDKDLMAMKYDLWLFIAAVIVVAVTMVTMLALEADAAVPVSTTLSIEQMADMRGALCE